MAGFSARIVLLCFVGLAGCRDRSPSVDHAISLVTSDGLRIAARSFIPDATTPPGLVLIHRLGGTKEAWEPLARSAQQAGYIVITLDLRGHGESRAQDGGSLDYRTFDDAQWQEAERDIEAAKQALIKAGADPRNLFLAGEALGASLALHYAVGDPEIQGVVMLSAGLDYQGMDTVKLVQEFATRPLLLVWSEGDAYAASSASALRRSAPGHVEVHSYPGAAHGADILALSPHSVGQIVVWLDQMLYKEPVETSEVAP